MTAKTKPRPVGAPINERALLTRPMAMDYLSIGRDLFDQYERHGDIVGIPIGKGTERRYRKSHLDALVDSMERQDTKVDRLKRSQK
jgi:hypothetical protein